LGQWANEQARVKLCSSGIWPAEKKKQSWEKKSFNAFKKRREQCLIIEERSRRS